MSVHLGSPRVVFDVVTDDVLQGMDYPITDEEVREVFAELKEKKLSLDENQQYSRNGND